MERTVIGIALFALVIVVGFIVGLRLSSPGPQRKAVGIAFGLMAAFAVLFYVFAIVLSLSWAALTFSVLTVLVPAVTYSLIVRHAKAPITVSRRNPNDPPRPPRNENRTRSAQASGPIDGAPATSGRPANDFYGSGPVYDDEPEYDEPAYEEEVEEVEEEEAFEPEPVSAELAEAFIDEYLVGENDIDDGFFEPEPSPTLRPHRDPDPVVSSSMMVTVPHPEGDERFLVVSESTAPANPILAYRRTTSSHLVHLGVAKNGEQNEAPLIAAALAAQRSAAAAEAVVAGEDDSYESYDFEMFEPEEARVPQYRTPIVAPPGESSGAREAPAAAVEEDFEYERERAPKHARAKHAPKAEPVLELAPEAAPSYEVGPEVAAARAYEPAATPQPEPAASPASAPAYEPAAASRVEYAPAPANEYAYGSVSQPAPEPASYRSAPAATPTPTSAPAYEPAAPDFSYSLETLFQREPEPAPEPAYEELPLFEMQSTSVFVPIGAEPQPAATPAPAAAAAYEPAPTAVPAYEPAPAHEPTPAAASRVESAPAAAQPAPAPRPAAAAAAQPVTPAAAPAPTSAAPKSQLTPFESYMAKAEGLRAKGVYTMAARVYNEAAIAADSTADNHRARFEEIACYVAAGQGEKAQAVAATLRASSVLTKVERFKLNAIERMA